MLKLELCPPDEEFQPIVGLPYWLSRLLFARGIRGEEAARRFLHPAAEDIRPPLLLHGMERAAALLSQAKEEKKRVVIYGDYDVDGICASAVLWEALGRCGIDRTVYIPDRHSEGYGLNRAAVEKLAKEYQVLVTVDCGITSIEEVAAARTAGMQVIVTDHHRHGETLPPADAVISPLLNDYPFPSLCGAGVAWKLAMALTGGGAMDLMPLCALATVADMVPLLDENRAIVTLGLAMLSRGEGTPLGLKALMRLAGVRDKVSSEQIAFQIAPRMNASGRMESAMTALNLLITRDADQAEALALKLEGLNQERRKQEALVLEEAEKQAADMDLVSLKAIVVSGEGWNSGVVGLAAGRIAERYAYPTVALAREGEKCVGSARSAGDVDIYAALKECADLFERFGGHRQAAGLTLKTENLAEFTRRLSQAVEKQTGGAALAPRMICDGELTLSQVTEETVRWLEKLEPFGMGNPAPRFLCEGVTPLSLRAVGAQGAHLKCTFRQQEAIRDGIFFGGGGMAGAPGGQFRMVMTPTLNEFRGKVSAECRLYALQLQPETLEEDTEAEALSLLMDWEAEGEAEEISPDRLDGLMAGGQGTLLSCRSLQTALLFRRRFPEADFSFGKAEDSRAYNTVLLSGRAADTCASYRYVVLCDGPLGDAGAFRRACPRAAVYVLPLSKEARRLLAGMFLDKDALRNCYRLLRDKAPWDLDGWAAACGLSPARAAFALKVFSEIGLIDAAFRPFRVSVLPMTRRDPEESALFRLSRQAKEETDGLYSL